MTTTIDTNQAEAFAGRIVGLVNDATLSLLVSIGHRVGLYDLMARMAPATSEDIAGKAGLDERYVREWLAAMTVGGIVEHDPGGNTYALPLEHAASLTRDAGPDNLASYTQFVAMLADVEDDIVACFRDGGGVPYSRFGTFHRLMSELSGQTYDAALIDVILPLAPELPARLEQGIDVGDVGCGAGHAVNLMAEAYPNSRFTGIDVSEEAIATARADAADKGVTNADFIVQDAATLDGSHQWDCITAFDAIHDQARPDLVLDGISASLRPDGVFLCVDIAADSHVAGNLDHPLGPFIYSVSTMHCMTVSLAEDGMGLGTAWGEQKALEMFGDAGFTNVAIEKVEGDPINNYYLARTS